MGVFTDEQLAEFTREDLLQRIATYEGWFEFFNTQNDWLLPAMQDNINALSNALANENFAGAAVAAAAMGNDLINTQARVGVLAEGVSQYAELVNELLRRGGGTMSDAEVFLAWMRIANAAPGNND